MNTMYDNLARRAIAAALANDWAGALQTNLQILKEEKEDVDALNRAARAYLQLGDISNAISFSQTVAQIDPLNKIAQKCLIKCAALQTNGHDAVHWSTHVSDNVFLEVPGKTKIVSLVNLCETGILAQLNAGENVQMVPKMHKVSVTTIGELYIGRLPDDLATKIIYFSKNGNEYEAYIKSATASDVTIFIKETKRAENIAHLPSFPVR